MYTLMPHLKFIKIAIERCVSGLAMGLVRTKIVNLRCDFKKNDCDTGDEMKFKTQIF